MSKPTEQPVLKDDLMGLKEKLEAIEAEFEVKLEEVERKNQKYEEVDSKLEELLSQNNSLMSLNVGGKVFQTRLSTLLSIKDTLFYYVLAKRVMSNADVHEEIFVDRNYTNFDFFLELTREFFKTLLLRICQIELFLEGIILFSKFEKFIFKVIANICLNLSAICIEDSHSLACMSS